MINYMMVLNGLTPLELLAQAQSNVPATPEWSASVASVMIICNLLAIAVVRFWLPIPAQGGGVSNANSTENTAIQVLTGASIGHIIGVGVILGLANVGVL